MIFCYARVVIHFLVFVVLNWFSALVTTMVSVEDVLCGHACTHVFVSTCNDCNMKSHVVIHD